MRNFRSLWIVITLDLSFISLRGVAGYARLLAMRRGGAATETAASEQPVDRATRQGRRLLRPYGVCREEHYFCKTNSGIIALFKPQFEAHKSEVPRGGVIRDAQLHAMLIGRFAAWCVGNSFRIVDLTTSPILGAAGNREFFFLLRPIDRRSGTHEQGRYFRPLALVCRRAAGGEVKTSSGQGRRGVADQRLG